MSLMLKTKSQSQNFAIDEVNIIKILLKILKHCCKRKFESKGQIF